MKTLTPVIVLMALTARGYGATALFDFNSGPPHAPITSAFPLDLTVDGITAHFSATGQGFSIQDTQQVIGTLPTGFSELGIAPASVFPADLLVSFPNNVATDFSIMVAPQELNTPSTATMRVTAYMNGVFVGTSTSTGVEPFFWPSSTLSFSSAQGFNSVMVHYDSPPPGAPREDYGPIFVADNMNVTATAIPEPSAFALLGFGALGLICWRTKMRRITGVKKTLLVGLVAALLSCHDRVAAATTQTVGAGSAVISVDRSATFDSLTSTNVVHLDTYAEGGLSVTTSGNSWAEDLSTAATLDPFHGGGGADNKFYAISFGNEDWVTIQTADAVLQKMFGVEFTYGNTWTTGDVGGQYPWGNHNAVVEWQTWNNGSLVSSGAVGGSPLLEVGTILGFSDPNGFDQLLVRAIIDTPGSPPLQAIALDNLNVQLTNVPEPSTWIMSVVCVLLLLGHRQSRGRAT